MERRGALAALLRRTFVLDVSGCWRWGASDAEVHLSEEEALSQLRELPGLKPA